MRPKLRSLARSKERGTRSRSNGKRGIACSSIFYLFSAIVIVGVVSVISFYVFANHKDLSDLNDVAHILTDRVIKESVKISPKLGLHPRLPIPTKKDPKPKQQTKAKPKQQKPLQGQKFVDLHFIHVPKCGGTSMTAILRQMACSMNTTKNEDCCTNPGFCDWHAKRRCKAIKGCTDHFPNRPWIFSPAPSVTILREPVARILSAWFYRCHTPNDDCFQVRPYFKEIKFGQRPKVVFEEYIEMNEYQNIQTRMLGADSFPYRNISIDEAVFAKAVEALDAIHFVGLQEVYEISVQVLLREMHMGHLAVPIKKERDQSNPKMDAQKKSIRDNKKVMDRTHKLNHYDVELYKLGVAKFCDTVAKYPDLMAKVKASKKVSCK